MSFYLLFSHKLLIYYVIYKKKFREKDFCSVLMRKRKLCYITFYDIICRCLVCIYVVIRYTVYLSCHVRMSCMYAHIVVRCKC